MQLEHEKCLEMMFLPNAQIEPILVYSSPSLKAGCSARIFAITQPTSPNRDMDNRIHWNPALKNIMGRRNFLSNKQIFLSPIQEIKRKDMEGSRFRIRSRYRSFTFYIRFSWMLMNHNNIICMINKIF